MRRFFLSLIACALLAPSLAAKIEVTFDNIPPSRPLPKGYGGITWTDGWYSLNAVAPYAAHSGTRNAAPIYKGSGSGEEGGERKFELEHGDMGGYPMGQGFLGLWIVGVGTVKGKPQTAKLKMYSGSGYLVATSNTVTLVPNTPVWIFSGYTGAVTKVGVEVNAGIKFFTIDDVTLISDGQWTKKTDPHAAWGIAMAYDEKRREMVLFDGSETWTWDGVKWTRENPTKSPLFFTDRVPAMAYDSVRGVVVLFGCGDYFDETWTWDGRDWTLKRPATKPPGRYDAAMVFDVVRRVVVLFGGANNGDSRNDTWTWNGNNWTQKFPKSKPLPRSQHAMAYDPIRKQVVFFGGFYSDEWDFGGTNDTWTWDGNNWTQRSTRGTPWPRWGHLMAWDGGSGGVLLFGGSDRYAGPYNDTWLWNGRIWRCQPRTKSPTNGWPMAWDAYRKEVVMVVWEAGFSSRTWVWKGHPPEASTPTIFEAGQ